MRHTRMGATVFAAMIVFGSHAIALGQAKTAKKTLVVAADGSGQFKTVQEAVDSAPDGNIRINIKPGEYRDSHPRHQQRRRAARAGKNAAGHRARL